MIRFHWLSLTLLCFGSVRSSDPSKHHGLVFAPFLSGGLHPNFYNLRLYNLSLKAATRIFSFHAQFLLQSVRLIRYLHEQKPLTKDTDINDVVSKELNREPCSIEGDGVELTPLDRELANAINDPMFGTWSRRSLGLPDPASVEKRILSSVQASLGAQALALAMNLKLDDADVNDDGQSALQKGGGDVKLARRKRKSPQDAGEEEDSDKRQKTETKESEKDEQGPASEESKDDVAGEKEKDAIVEERRMRQELRPTVEEVTSLLMGGCDR